MLSAFIEATTLTSIVFHCLVARQVTVHPELQVKVVINQVTLVSLFRLLLAKTLSSPSSMCFFFASHFQLLLP